MERVAAPHPVIGFRGWRVDYQGRLRPTYMDSYIWRPGVNLARCLKLHFHRKPAPHGPCSCGFYAFHELRDALLHPQSSVVGIVRGWGKLEGHNSGWRSQFVEVLAIIERIGTTADEHRRMLGIAGRYKVPLISERAVEAMASEFGQTMPKELRPDTPLYAKHRATFWEGWVPVVVISAVLYGLTMVGFACCLAIQSAWHRIQRWWNHR